MAKYCPLFSGSKGNCTFLGTAQNGILVDVGVSAKRIQEALAARQIDLRAIRAIFITHEHTDHIAGLNVLLKRQAIPVYATRGTMEALLEKGVLPVGTPIETIDSAVSVGDLGVTAFKTSHDSAESCGFRVTYPDGRVAVVATDMGCMTPAAWQALQGADLVHIESNHDVRMLECGPYPYSLKMRVLGEGGHLSNEACARVLPTLVQNGTTRFVLSHLSQENNTPLLAKETSKTALSSVGAAENEDYLLSVAAPVGDDPVIVF